MKDGPLPSSLIIDLIMLHAPYTNMNAACDEHHVLLHIYKWSPCSQYPLIYVHLFSTVILCRKKQQTCDAIVRFFMVQYIKLIIINHNFVCILFGMSSLLLYVYRISSNSRRPRIVAAQSKALEQNKRRPRIVATASKCGMRTCVNDF